MLRIIVTIYLLANLAAAQAQWVSTVAGVLETPGFNDGTALAARFFIPHGIAADSSGRIYIADRNNHTIRLFDPSVGTVTTLAGLAGQPGSTDGAGSAARFNEPWGLCSTPGGILYVADTKNNKIRKVLPDGTVTTIAGTGNFGTSNGAALSSTFGNPTGIEVDKLGNIYVADHLTHIIRKVSTSGNVSTLAGTPYVPGDADGTGVSAQFWRPYGLTLDQQGNILVADEWNHKIRLVTPLGVVSTLAGNGLEGYADGAAADASFNFPWDVTVDADGNAYVADGYNYLIRKIATDGQVTSIAGTLQTQGNQDGQGNNASFSGASSITWVQQSGSLFVTDTYNQIIRSIQLSGGPTLALLNLNGSDQICEGDALSLTAAPVTFDNYRFYLDSTMVQDNGSADYTTALLTPGTHTFTVETTMQGQTLTSNSVVVTVKPMPQTSISAVGPLSFFEGDSVILIPSGTGDFLWSNGESTQAITVTESGTYFVEITVDGCTGISAAVEVEVTPLPDAVSILVDGNGMLCPGTTAQLTSSAAVGNQWLKDGWPLPGQTSQHLETGEEGIYQAQVTAPVTGITTLSNEVEISFFPSANFDLRATPQVGTPGQEVAFSAVGNSQPVTFKWQFGDPSSGSLNSSQEPAPIHRYDAAGIYSVQLTTTDTYGCQDTIAKHNFIQINEGTVSQPGIFFPNAFTPNGDGENDIFRVRGYPDGPFFMAIFNEWGERVFLSESPTHGWDGNRDGLPVQSGNFVYFAQLGKYEFSGQVTLLR